MCDVGYENTYFLMTRVEEQVDSFCKKPATNLASECSVITQNQKLLFAVIRPLNH